MYQYVSISILVEVRTSFTSAIAYTKISILCYKVFRTQTFMYSLVQSSARYMFSHLVTEVNS